MSTIYPTEDTPAVRLMAKAAHLDALTALMAGGGLSDTTESLLELAQDLAHEVNTLVHAVLAQRTEGAAA